MITGWFFGFSKPWLHPHGMFGHVEAWGCDEDRSWVFVDPRGAGTRVEVFFRYEDVEDVLTVMNTRCDLILWMPQPVGIFRVPLFPPMTCAGICGSLVGLRALVPWTLRRKLLANGAEIVHEGAKGRPGRSRSADAGTETIGD